jgi:hypothetical protein
VRQHTACNAAAGLLIRRHQPPRRRLPPRRTGFLAYRPCLLYARCAATARVLFWMAQLSAPLLYVLWRSPVQRRDEKDWRACRGRRVCGCGAGAPSQAAARTCPRRASRQHVTSFPPAMCLRSTAPIAGSSRKRRIGHSSSQAAIIHMARLAFATNVLPNHPEVALLSISQWRCARPYHTL